MNDEKGKKQKAISARVTDEMYQEIQKYIKDDGSNLGYLIRKAVRHYMWANPIEQTNRKEN